MLRTHCQTSGWSLTEQDPYNNVVRTTIEAMAAVFGGTQSLHTNSFDEAIALPTEFSSRIARNTQLIIQEETHITNVVDPWAGSYMMEKLTQDMADAAWTIIEEVEAMGGMTQAVDSGWAKLKIEAARRREAGAHRLRQGRDRRRQQIQAEDRRRDRDARHRQRGGARRADRAAEAGQAPNATTPAVPRSTALTRCAETGEGNLLDLAIKAMRLRATVGEVSDALEKVWGRHRADTQKVTGVYAAAYDSAEGWDKLKSEIERFAEDAGPPPARDDRQAGPGRPRPRRQGGGHRVCRPRLRRRHRARCSRPPKSARARRSRTTCMRSASARWRPATRRWCRRSSRR